MKPPRETHEEFSDFELSDSDYDYDDNEKLLLENARRRPNNENEEEEVLGLPSDDDVDDSDDDDDDFEKDIVEEDGDGLPNAKAWGRNKKLYYNTDYVDKDFGGFEGKDADDAENEEKEARAIQERLLQEIDDADYMLDIFETPSSKEEQELEEKVQTDYTALSKRQRRELFKKDSPEFPGLVEDYLAKMHEVNDKLEPMLALIEEGKVPASPLSSFVKTKYHLVLNYCTNIVFYLLLKSRRVPIQSHPVVQRLFQYRQLLKQLEDVDHVAIEQIDEILKIVSEGSELKFKKVKEKSSFQMKKAKKLMEKTQLSKATDLSDAGSTDDIEMDEDMEDDGDQKLLQQLQTENKEEESKKGEEGEAKEEMERRAITYQIKKNKGLTPRRKKEQRNPRVKNRNKYKKAKIRRKGQVREARKELQKYGGEISGIKIGVTKSIKLK